MKRPLTPLGFYRRMIRKHGYIVLGQLPNPTPRWTKGTTLYEMCGRPAPFKLVTTEPTTSAEWLRQWAELTDRPLQAIRPGTKFWRVVRAPKGKV